MGATPIAFHHTFQLGTTVCRHAQAIDDNVADLENPIARAHAPIDSDRIDGRAVCRRRARRDGIARAPYYARRRIDKKKPAGPRRRMAGFFLHPECYYYSNFENKVQRFRFWRPDGRAAAPIASSFFRISTLFPGHWTRFRQAGQICPLQSVDAAIILPRYVGRVLEHGAVQANAAGAGKRSGTAAGLDEASPVNWSAIFKPSGKLSST